MNIAWLAIVLMRQLSMMSWLVRSAGTRSSAAVVAVAASYCSSFLLYADLRTAQCY